jgi:membrane protein YqaA with SNARE-associated domain
MQAVLYTVIGNALGISVAYWLGMDYADRIVLRLFGKK